MSLINAQKSGRVKAARMTSKRIERPNRLIAGPQDLGTLANALLRAATTSVSGQLGATTKGQRKNITVPLHESSHEAVRSKRKRLPRGATPAAEQTHLSLAPCAPAKAAFLAAAAALRLAARDRRSSPSSSSPPPSVRVNRADFSALAKRACLSTSAF